MIYQLRDAARKTTIAELSRKSGINRETLYQALSEKGNPSLSTLVALAAALELEIDLKPLRDIADDSKNNAVLQITETSISSAQISNDVNLVPTEIDTNNCD